MKRFISIILSLAMFQAIFAASALAYSDQSANVQPISSVAADSGYDFSSMDDINIYDTYEKEEKNGILYVETGKQYRLEYDLNEFRYGSFLRNAEERQYFSVYNLDYDDAICCNVLTIYADPTVEFYMNDYDGNLVFDSTGYYVKSKVDYYNKSQDNGHAVYYIELNPVEPGKGVQIMEFSTKSTTTQPHYSFWYGQPLVKTGTARGKLFNVTLTSPKTSSAVATVSAPYGIPERAWISKITVKKETAMSTSAISRGYLKVTLPDNGYWSDGPARTEFSDTSDMVFDVSPIGSPFAAPANGRYQFSLDRISWKYGTPSAL